jgi:predicted ester cyclase
MTLEDNKAVTFRFMQSFDKRDIAGCRAQLGPGFQATMNGSPPMDVDAFQQLGQAFLDGFTDARHEVKYSVAEGDRVIVVTTWRGKHTGNFQGIPPTGKTVVLEMVQSDRIAGGKIVSHDGIFDTHALLQQLGAAPSPGR